MMRNTALRCAAALLSVALIGAAGCGGFTVILPDVPQQCFQEDVVGTECYTEEYFIEVCEEVCDFFGCFIECYDEPVVDVYCEDVLIDSYIICE